MSEPFKVVGTELHARMIPYQRMHKDVWFDRLTWGALDANDYLPAGSTLRLQTEHDGVPHYFGSSRTVLRRNWEPR